MGKKQNKRKNKTTNTSNSFNPKRNTEEIRKIHAGVVFAHNRTCCVCRDSKKKHIQVHHIDENNSNDHISNLAVLCLDCHADTQIKGGFDKKLDARLVRLFRDEWIRIVESKKLSRINTKPADGLIIGKISHPLELFLGQFKERQILPIDASYYFHDYYMEGPYLGVMAATEGLTPENAQFRTSVLKAYVFCILGEITPVGFLETDSYKPSQALRKIMLRSNWSIGVPNWIIPEFGGPGLLQIRGVSFVVHQQIELTFSPLMIKVNEMENKDYCRIVIGKLEIIAKSLVGKVIEL